MELSGRENIRGGIDPQFVCLGEGSSGEQ